jgi:hypothetical protein
MRAAGLVCLEAGTGLIRGDLRDLRDVRGSDVARRSGGVIVAASRARTLMRALKTPPRRLHIRTRSARITRSEPEATTHRRSRLLPTLPSRGRTVDLFGRPEGFRRAAASTGPAVAGRTGRCERNRGPDFCVASRNTKVGSNVYLMRRSPPPDRPTIREGTLETSVPKFAPTAPRRPNSRSR